MIATAVHDPVFHPLTSAITAALGGGYAAIINDAGQLASYVTFTRSSTATYFDSNGVLQIAAANQPRYDYDPVTLQLRGLLVEEQRTNLLVRSAEFDNASWTKDAGTVTANAATAPDGTLTADKYIPDATNVGTHRVRQLTTNTTAAHSISFYAKADGYNWIKVRLAAQFVNFNISTGAIGQSIGGSGVIQSVGNGWYRCTANLAPGSANGLAYIYASTTDDANADTTAFAGNGTSGIFIWGAQLEAGAFATSYIPTTTAAVTRAGDVANITNLSSIGFNALEGSFFSEAVFPPNRPASGGWNPVIFQLRENSGLSSYMGINMSGASANWSVYDAASVAQANISMGSPPSLSLSKFSVCYKLNDFAAVRDGGVVGTDLSGALGAPIAMTVGSSNAGSGGHINGHIRRLRYYPRRLTNTELQALTA